jgi:hypothetical protein
LKDVQTINEARIEESVALRVKCEIMKEIRAKMEMDMLY